MQKQITVTLSGKEVEAAIAAYLATRGYLADQISVQIGTETTGHGATELSYSVLKGATCVVREQAVGSETT